MRRLCGGISPVPPNGGASILAAYESTDQVRRRYEDKWGWGRLPQLVNPELAARFGKALKRFHDALDSGDPDRVTSRAEVLCRGWRALDEAADAAGIKPCQHSDVWAWRTEEDRLFVIAKDADARVEALKTYDEGEVWILDEIVRILDYIGQKDEMLREIKNRFGAEVVSIKPGVVKRKREAKPDLSLEELNDDIPF